MTDVVADAHSIVWFMDGGPSAVSRGLGCDSREVEVSRANLHCFYLAGGIEVIDSVAWVLDLSSCAIAESPIKLKFP